MVREDAAVLTVRRWVFGDRAPRVGLEPTTNGPTVHCSATAIALLLALVMLNLLISRMSRQQRTLAKRITLSAENLLSPYESASPLRQAGVLPGSVLGAVGHTHYAQEPVDGQPAERLGFPAARSMADPRKVDSG